MAMKRGAAVMVAVLALAGAAAAGTEQDPEIADPAGDTQVPNATWADLLAGWFNETATDVVVTLQVGDMTVTPPGTAWYAVFDTAGMTFGVACQSDGGGAVTCGYGHWDRTNGPTDFTTGPGSLAGSLITMNMPQAFANASAGAVLTSIEAGSGQLSPLGIIPAPVPVPLPGAAQFQQLDSAQASRDYVLGGAIPAPPPSNNTGNGTGNETAPPPTQGTPGFELPAVLGAAGLVALAVRRRR